MSDKPEKIWISDLGVDDLEKGLDVVQVSKIPDDWMKHEYTRSDLANQIPQPSEVYDRIQGYLRVIQEKDALLADQAKPSGRSVKRVYCAGNRTSNIFFESEKDALVYQSSAGAACGVNVWPVDIIPSMIPTDEETP